MLAAGVGAGAGLALANDPTDTEELVRLLLAASLGLSLFFAVALLGERRGWGTGRRVAVSLVGVAALGLVWALWPRWPEPVQIARYLQLAAGFHLLVAFLPYIGYREPNGFWQYNRTLFTRLITAVVYSGVLFAGLAVAFLALDKLFGIAVPDEGYARLWVVIAYLFNTWFFLAGVPEDFRTLESTPDYPKELRLFTQYLLVPIVVTYLTILTLYLTKVLITRQWPSGWIGYLVSAVAAVGIFAWLLVRPLEDDPEHRWVRRYTRSFFIAIMPAIIMLWLAIGQRVGQYGITERRYFLIALSLWLAGIAVYYTVSRSRNIAVIPASLCALALLSIAGPWGAYSVSRTSQIRHLAALLEHNGMLAGGRVRATTRAVSFDDQKEISGTLEYLLQTHGGSEFAGWFPDSLRSQLAIPPTGSRYAAAHHRAQRVMRGLGLRYVDRWERRGSQQTLNYYAAVEHDPVEIGGYDYAVRLSPRLTQDSIPIGGQAWARYDRTRQGIRIMRRGQDLLLIPLDSVIRQARAFDRRGGGAAGTRAPLLRAEARSGEPGGAAALLLLSSLYGTMAHDSTAIGSLAGDLFVKLP